MSYIEKIAERGWRCLGTLRLQQTVPTMLRHAVKDALRAGSLRRAIRRITNRPSWEVPDRNTLQELQIGWDNEGYGAELDYLEEVARRAVTTDGPVLECGSGITTILLGLLAGRGVEIWTLEHHPEWKMRVEAVLKQYHIPGIELCSVPLRDYENFDWYDPPLDRMPKDFRIVVCDGPPCTTRGGRYGLLSILGERLCPGAIILLDDAVPGSETLNRWTVEAGVSVKRCDLSDRP